MSDSNWKDSLKHRLVHQPGRLFASVILSGVGLSGGFVALFGAGPRVVGGLTIGLVGTFLLGRHWALKDAWTRTEERLQRELTRERNLTSALQMTQKEKDEETRAYMRALADVVERYATPFEEELTIAYYIGATDSEDRIERYHRTRGLGDGPSERLLWRTFEESATGRNARYESFENIGLTVASDEDPYRVEFLPLEESAARLRGMLSFNPPLGSDPALNWTLSYKWPGMWRELRENLHDTAFVVGARGLTKLKVALIFPAGASEPRFTSRPPLGTVTRERRGGRWVLMWRIDDPQPTRYDFGVAVDRISGA